MFFSTNIKAATKQVRLSHGLAQWNRPYFFQILQVCPCAQIGTGGIDGVAEFVEIFLLLGSSWSSAEHHLVRFSNSARVWKLAFLRNHCATLSSVGVVLTVAVN